MKKTMIVAAVAVASITTAVGLISQVRVASAAVTPLSTLAVMQIEPLAVAPPMSRRERMARIVAEQAAITAEATARNAMARKAVARDSASR